jgi:hypothetical protein
LRQLNLPPLHDRIPPRFARKRSEADSGGNANRIPVMVAGTLLYGALVAVAVMRGWPHYELLAIFLQAVLLLPALLYGLKGREPGPQQLPIPARVGLWTAAFMGVFLIGSAALSAINTQGFSNPDEVAYRFQARILGAGKLMAAPPPGAPQKPEAVPLPLRFNNLILWRNGWFAKYPLGWPLVLALPEKVGWGWLVNPLLAVGILICTARIAGTLSGPEVSFCAVALLVLSPCFLAPSVQLMTHATAGLLVASSCWAWMEGMRRRRLSYFFFMYLLVGLTFHVRPFTALLTAATLTGGVILTLRREPGALAKTLAIGAAVGAVTVGSVLLYNRTFTGNLWLSPYAFARGLNVPVEISASVPQALRNMKEMWRFSLQSTLLFFFPLIFVLAAVGFWKNRKTSPMVWLLLSLFLVIVLGHLVQTEDSGSVLAERYWFESYFAVAILAAQGIAAVVAAFKSPRPSVIAAGCSLLAVQLMVTIAASKIVLQRSAPSIAVAHLAGQFRDCRCVVFLRSSPPFFAAQHLNLNGPGWQQEQVFYAVDPGPGQRMAWARTLGRERWVVVGYDPLAGRALQEREP